MKTRSAVFLSLIIVVLVSLLSLWFTTSVQDFMAANRTWNGLRAFISESEGTLLDKPAGNIPSPEDVTLIVIPYMEYSDTEMSSLKEFVDNGGELLLLDDFGFGNEVLDYFNVSPRFSTVPLLDPLFNYRDLWLPRITDFDVSVLEKNPDIQLAVLNHATAITGTGYFQVLAWSSKSSYLDVDGNNVASDKDTVGPLPVAAKVDYGKGSIVLLSDPSVMINSMVGRDDNFAFLQTLAALDRNRSIIIDTSHLTKSPIDISKSGLATVRDILVQPYAVLGFIAIIFIGVWALWLRGGQPVEGK